MHRYINNTITRVSIYSGLKRKKKSKNKYTAHYTVRMVVVNELNPTEALRVCLNPCSWQMLNYLLANTKDNKLYFEQMYNTNLAVLLENVFEDMVSSLTPNSIEPISTRKGLIRPNTQSNKNRSNSRISGKKAYLLTYNLLFQIESKNQRWYL